MTSAHSSQYESNAESAAGLPDTSASAAPQQQGAVASPLPFAHTDFRSVLVIDLLFDFLDVSTLLSISQVCREWRQKLDGNECFMWALKSKQLWPALPQPQLPSSRYYKSIKSLVVYKALMLDEQARFRRFLRSNFTAEQLQKIDIHLDSKAPITERKPIVRPLNGFMLFCSQNREKVKESMGPTPRMTDLVRKLADMWKEMTEEERSSYLAEAEEKKKLYQELKKIDEAVWQSGPGKVLRFQIVASKFFADSASFANDAISDEYDDEMLEEFEDEEEGEESSSNPKPDPFYDALADALQNGKEVHIIGVNASGKTARYCMFSKYRDPMDPLVIDASYYNESSAEDESGVAFSIVRHVRCKNLATDLQGDVSAINEAILGKPWIHEGSETRVSKKRLMWLDNLFITKSVGWVDRRSEWDRLLYGDD